MCVCVCLVLLRIPFLGWFSRERRNLDVPREMYWVIQSRSWEIPHGPPRPFMIMTQFGCKSTPQPNSYSLGPCSVTGNTHATAHCVHVLLHSYLHSCWRTETATTNMVGFFSFSIVSKWGKQPKRNQTQCPHVEAHPNRKTSRIDQHLLVLSGE